MTDRTPMQRALDKDVQIEELARRVEVLEGALRPFDKIAGELFALNYNRADAVFSLIASPDVLRLKAGDFFDVRAALSTPSVGGSLAEENERLREALQTVRRQRDDMTAAYNAEMGAKRPADEAGWLIELDPDIYLTGPRWWSRVDDEEGVFGWSDDPIKALRFARQQDAQAYIDDTGWTGAIATEHLWVSPVAALSGKEPK